MATSLKDTRLDAGGGHGLIGATQVALKILRAPLAGNPQFRERFDREARSFTDVGAATAAHAAASRPRRFQLWRAIVECLDEAGDDLFTFLRFPKLRGKP